MSEGSIGLELGELADAAATVRAAVEPLNRVLTELSDGVAVAATGFRGQAATGLGEALDAWFDAAATLGPILEGYSQALATTATEHATNEGRQVASYARLTSRLGGGVS
ncbi:WXG100 family type VII secretion target [Nocardioides sp. GCM10027113]|uniref:WXG100 family type VII secretion target n=1 Tax=unclassified Nocardioides TaxID=2615069 RepID=UPI0036108634